jgi:hypothetical protein
MTRLADLYEGFPKSYENMSSFAFVDIFMASCDRFDLFNKTDLYVVFIFTLKK